MRVILYTGKGGVGKTTVAAATALRAAELGQRTVVLSADAAHSLADSFDIKLSGVPQLIVRAGNHRRNILLPHTLVGLPIKEAKFEGDRLQIRFGEKGDRKGQS